MPDFLLVPLLFLSMLIAMPIVAIGLFAQKKPDTAKKVAGSVAGEVFKRLLK